MNPWCESCARKNLCYVVDDRPKCFVPITNTASGTPKSYLAKSLLYSRDSHEIAKDEPQLTPNYCGTCKHREVPCGDLPCDVCHGYSNYEPKDEPQTETKTETQNSNLTFEKADESQADCQWK